MYSEPVCQFVCVHPHLSALLFPECSCSSSAPLHSEMVAVTWQSAQAAKRHKFQQSRLGDVLFQLHIHNIMLLSPSKLKQQQHHNLRSSQALLCTSYPGLCLSAVVLKKTFKGYKRSPAGVHKKKLKPSIILG